MSDPRDSRELAEDAAAGDAGAVEELLARHLAELRAFVRLRAGPLVRARESSSDLVQSVCRDVLSNMERFRHPSDNAFKRWLFKTAVRKIHDRREYYLAEKRDALRSVPIAETGDEAPGGIRGSQLVDLYRTFTSPSHRAMVGDEIARVESAFDQLTEEEREVVTLAHLVGLSRAEIADQLERSEGAVRVLLHRTLAKLADLLADSDA